MDLEEIFFANTDNPCLGVCLDVCEVGVDVVSRLQVVFGYFLAKGFFYELLSGFSNYN